MLHGKDIASAFIAEIPILAKLYPADKTTGLDIVTGICLSTRNVPKPA